MMAFPTLLRRGALSAARLPGDASPAVVGTAPAVGCLWSLLLMVRTLHDLVHYYTSLTYRAYEGLASTTNRSLMAPRASKSPELRNMP